MRAGQAASVGIADAVAVLGIVLVVYGVGLSSLSAGLIAAGVGLVVLAVLMALRHG